MRRAAHISAAAAYVTVVLTAAAVQARAEDRSRLVSCQAAIDHAAPAAKNDGVGARPDDAELTRCRQIVREWMLRDARMSVDEKGRPIR
jgi:hypothetical protein